MSKEPLYPHIPQKHTVMKVRCGWCGRDMGEKEGYGTKGETTTICPECYKKEMNKTKETRHG